MNKKALRIVAGVLFLLLAAIPFVLTLTGRSGSHLWSYYVGLAGYLLIAISLITDLSILTTLGAAGPIINEARNLVIYLRFVMNPSEYVLSENVSLYSLKLRMVITIGIIIAFLLLALCGLVKNAAKPLGILSGALYAIAYIARIALGLVSFTPLGALHVGLFVVGAILLGIGFSEPKSNATYAYRTTPPQSDISAQLDQLTRLKSLLDMGALTQEEFEEKKRQLLEQ